MRNKSLLNWEISTNWPKLVPFATNICVGLSGGVDSIVLLHLLKNATPSLNISAIHVNHGISPNAQSWTEFCQRFCKNLNIPLYVKYISLDKQGGESLENEARKARLNIFLESDFKIIALAHHQDDQVETTLSQFLRGSDLHNIAAMHEISNRQNKVFWRPLLNFSRAQIEEYARHHNLQYITDESNLDTKYLRNFIRHDIMPLLKNWDINVASKILNFNEQLQDLLKITDEIARLDLQAAHSNEKQIDVEHFAKLSNQRQNNMLSQFIKSNCLPLPSYKQLTEFARQCVSSSWDKKPQLKLNDSILLIKYKNYISLQNI